jgi:hypothetical protein
MKQFDQMKQLMKMMPNMMGQMNKKGRGGFKLTFGKLF